MNTALAFAAWQTVAGELTAGRTKPISLENDRLLVAVPDKTWQRNLEALAPQLLFRLVSVLGRPVVDRIEFFIDPDTIGDKVSEPTHPVRDIAAPTAVAESARRIRDEKLREKVIKAAAHCLSRHR